jgi:hypothetical protein
MRLSPEATFDCLFMAARLQRDSGTFTASELHLFAYLACLLWLYRRRATADWGYSFVSTDLGAPFSIDIDGVIRELQSRGYLVRVQERLRTSNTADQQLNVFLGLTLNAERIECLHAACSSTSALSVGMVGSALAQEPELRRARAMPNNRPLLEDTAQSQLYEHFDALHRALNKEDIDLRVPAVVWLSALYRSDDQTVA